MKLADNLVPASLVTRLNRFSALVKVGGVEETVFLPNSGRLRELLVPTRPVFLAPRESPGRRTRYDLALADVNGLLVSVDARLPGDLVAEALREGLLVPLRGYQRIKREFPFAHSRLDFLLEGEGRCLVEAKSVTKVIDGAALFPDAQTSRGRRHLMSLMQGKREGYRAAVLFVVQRADAHRFSPDDATDPLFGQALREAAAAGVEVYAYSCRVSFGEVRIDHPLEVVL